MCRPITSSLTLPPTANMKNLKGGTAWPALGAQDTCVPTAYSKACKSNATWNFARILTDFKLGQR
jgi:hypothetical protein